VDPGRPSSSSPCRSFVLACEPTRSSPSAFLRFSAPSLSGLYQASGSTLFPVAYVVPYGRFNRIVRTSIPLCDCSTRYEWLVKPYSPETFTLEGASSFAWRTKKMTVIWESDLKKTHLEQLSPTFAEYFFYEGAFSEGT